MPFYDCLAPAGLLTQEMKGEIAREVTRIHVAATGGLPQFVQVQFTAVAPGDAFQGGGPSAAIRLHARMRAGRTAAVRHGMLRDYTAMLHRITGAAVADIMIGFIETSYENVMEAGVRLPAPGKEAAWLAELEQNRAR